MRRALPLTLALALGLGLGGTPQPAVAGACKEISGVSNKGCVTKRDLKKKAVTSGKVKNESLTGKDIKDGSIGAADIEDGSIGAEDLAPDAVTGPTYVFLSSVTHDGAFGVAAWDALCKAEALAAGLSPGIYKAWLSASSVDAGDMLPSGPFIDPLGQFVALNKGDLLDGRILTQISNFAGGGSSMGGVWTGTAAGGTFLAPNCADWASNGPAVEGTNGAAVYVDGRWTNVFTLPCNSALHAYCFQVE